MKSKKINNFLFNKINHMVVGQGLGRCARHHPANGAWVGVWNPAIELKGSNKTAPFSQTKQSGRFLPDLSPAAYIS